MQTKIIKKWNRVLITCPHNLGDFVAKVPFIRLLKKEKQNCTIIVSGRSYLKELVSNIKEVDQFVDFEKLFNQDDESIIHDLKELHLDTIIHLLSIQNLKGPSVLNYAERAGIKNRIGNLYKSYWTLFKKRKEHLITHNLRKKRLIEGVHEYQWNLLPLSFFKIRNEYSLKEITELLKTEHQKDLSGPHLDKKRFNLIIHPGSNGNAKEWPLECYERLVECLDEKKFNVIFTGSKEEALKFSSLKIKKGLFLMGKLSLSDYIALLKNADGVLAASTGPVHIASLFSTKILALFPKQKEMGPSLWRPLGENAQTLECPSICLACQKKLTAFNPKLCSCMEKIDVKKVHRVLNQWSEDENLIRQ